MKILLSIILIAAATCVFVGFILFNHRRAREQDFKGITWSNIKKQTDIIKDLNGGVGEAHIDEEYAEKKFKELQAKDKAIAVLSVAAMLLFIIALIIVVVIVN